MSSLTPEFCKTLTPRQFVRLKYPTAFCETNGELYQVVVVGKYAAAAILGTGSNRRWAWSNAATTVQAAMVRQP